MSSNLSSLFIPKIHPSWLSYLQEMHWSGTLDAYLGKGYASFKLIEEERKKWGLTQVQENRINEILQSSIDKVNAEQKKNELLSLLTSVDSIFIPNQIDDKSIIDEVQKENEKTNNALLQQMLPFIDFTISNDQENLLKVFESWSGRHLRNVFHKGISLLVNLLIQKEIFYNYSTVDDIESKLNGLQHFYLTLYYHFNKYPDKTRIDIFKHFLLKKNKMITDCIDGILYRSWKQYPNEMFILTNEWIESGNPILVRWLIHGIEVPGRGDPLKAINFIKLAFFIDDKEVAYICSHVSATILCADPYQTFHIFERMLQEDRNSLIKNILITGLFDIITDKFTNKNSDIFDFPNLDKIIFDKMHEWNKLGDSVFNVISEIVLEKFYSNKILI